MALTLTLVAIGALGSAVVSFGSGETAVVMVTAWRFLLGAGLGGIFPLSAVANAECTSPRARAEAGRHRRVAWGMTGMFGAMITTPICMFAIEWVFADPAVAWRVMLGTGAVPALFVMVLNAGLTDGAEFERARERARQRPGLFAALRSRRNLLGLVAAGGSWFFLDYLWYGISISMPKITQDRTLPCEPSIPSFSPLPPPSPEGRVWRGIRHLDRAHQHGAHGALHPGLPPLHMGH